MGGQHSDLGTESFKKTDWTQVALKEKGEILWAHRRDANVKLVSYPIFSQSQKQFKHEKDLYYLRKNNPRLVSALALESFENSDFCSTQYKQTLFLEHIPITLSDIEHIPYPDHLHIYDQSFKGFQQLATAVGCFIVEEEHIGINQKGIVKVWLNGDFHRSFIVGCRVKEQIMVRSIVETIDKSSDEITLPRGIPSVKNYLFRNNDVLNFETILAEFNEYLKLYNEGKAPDRLACIDRVGIHTIVERDTHVWQRQGSVLEFHRNELYQQSNTHQSGVTSQRMYQGTSGYKSGTTAHQNLRNFERRLPEPSLMREVRSTQNIKAYGSPEKSNGSIPIFSQYSQSDRPALRPEFVRQNMTIYRKPEPFQPLPSPSNAPIIKIPAPQIKSPTLTAVKSSQFLRGSQFVSNPAPLAAQSQAPTPIKFIQNTLVSPNKQVVESPRNVVTFQSSQGILKNHQSPTGMKHSHIIQKIHYPPQSHPHFIAQNTTAPKLNPMSQSHLLTSAQPFNQPANSLYTSPSAHRNHQVKTVPITVEVVPGKVSFIEKLASQTSNSQLISPQQLQQPNGEAKKKANAQSVVSNKASAKKIHTNVPAFISKHQKTASNLKDEPVNTLEETKMAEKHVDNAIAMTHEKIEIALPEPVPFSQVRQVMSITESHQSHKLQVSQTQNHETILQTVQERPSSIKQPQQANIVGENTNQEQVISDPIEGEVDNESEHVSFTENSRQVDQHEATEQQQESSLMNEAELRSERLISQQINKSQEDYIVRPISYPNNNRFTQNSEQKEPQTLNSQLQSVQNQRMQSNINSQVEQSGQTGQIYQLEEENNLQFVNQKEHYSQIVQPTINDYSNYQTYQPKASLEVDQVEKYESPDPSIAGHSMASITGGEKDDKYSLWTAGNRDYVSASLSIEPTKEIAASFNPNFTNQTYGIPDVKTQKFELHGTNSDTSYNPFGGNNIVYSSFETAAIPTYESYESFQSKSYKDDKPAKIANIHIDDGKSSEDFLRKLREIGTGSSSSAAPLSSTSQTGYFNNYSSGYTNFKTGLNEDYGSSYLNNYGTSKYNYQDYQTPSYTSFAANAYEYQPKKYVDSQVYTFQSKFTNAYEPKSSFSDDDFGKNAVSNIIPTGYASGENSISYGEPLKFENNIALIYSRTEEVSPTQSPNGPSSYRARYDPQILADLQNLH